MIYICKTYKVPTSNEMNELLEIVKEYKKEEKKYIPSTNYEHNEITRQLRKTISINQQKLVQMGLNIDEIIKKTE